jgi:hypothetical protein
MAHKQNLMTEAEPVSETLRRYFYKRLSESYRNSPTVAHACRKRRLKWVLGAWGYNWATQSPGDINMETWSSRLGVGRGADDPTPEKVNS